MAYGNAKVSGIAKPTNYVAAPGELSPRPDAPGKNGLKAVIKTVSVRHWAPADDKGLDDHDG